jgi:hypothetical protein
MRILGQHRKAEVGRSSNTGGSRPNCVIYVRFIITGAGKCKNKGKQYQKTLHLDKLIVAAKIMNSRQPTILFTILML